MANAQILTSKFLSLRGQRWIHGEHGRLLFQASRPRIFGRAIEIKNPLGLVVATINPQLWKSHPTWEVITSDSNYNIKRRIKSFERLYYIEGGMFDGALIEGENFDRQFRISHHNKIIAQANEQLFSLIAKSTIEVMDGSEHASLLTAVVSIIISTEKQMAGMNRKKLNR